MRIVIFVGLIYIGDCIGEPTYTYQTAIASFMAIVGGMAFIMDVVEFFRNN